MFTPISAIFSLLFFASTLPNGIRLVELPAEPDSVQIVAGYTSAGLTAFTSTPAARSLLYDAYAVGARIDLVDDLDRTALRITAPKWALPVLSSRLAALFQDIPKGDEGAAPTPMDFRERIEEEIRGALLGAGDAGVDYSTENAFILMSELPPAALREALAAIPKRASGHRPEDAIGRLPAERTLRFKSDLPLGAVIFASPLPTAFYRQWYLLLLLDRLIHRVVPLPVKTSLPLAARPYYYRLELPVPSGQFPEPIEENLLQELQRLQFVQANARDLSASRDEALAYLDSKPVREWFASYDILSRREEGLQWIQSMTPDDMRVAARDLLIQNRVIATWAPKPAQTSVSSQPLTAVGAVGEAQARQRAASSDDRPGRSQSAPTVGEQPQLPPTQFPPHTNARISPAVSERLSSGVSLVASTTNAVFVSGGPITRFDRDLTADDLKAFQQYRTERILVLAPNASLDRARQLWSAFRGNPNGEIGVPKGKTSSGDLSALAVLKTILDLKIIESGWWREVSVRIDAGQGTDLQIAGTDDKRARILSWIKNLADSPLTDSTFEWVREVAVHQFANVNADLQAMIWERDPQGTVQDFQMVSAKHVQDVARIYF